MNLLKRAGIPNGKYTSAFKKKKKWVILTMKRTEMFRNEGRRNYNKF